MKGQTREKARGYDWRVLGFLEAAMMLMEEAGTLNQFGLNKNIITDAMVESKAHLLDAIHRLTRNIYFGTPEDK